MRFPPSPQLPGQSGQTFTLLVCNFWPTHLDLTHFHPALFVAVFFHHLDRSLSFKSLAASHLAPERIFVLRLFIFSIHFLWFTYFSRRIKIKKKIYISSESDSCTSYRILIRLYTNAFYCHIREVSFKRAVFPGEMDPVHVWPSV